MKSNNRPVVGKEVKAFLMCGKVAIATTEAAEKGYDFALLCFFFPETGYFEDTETTLKVLHLQHYYYYSSFVKPPL